MSIFGTIKNAIFGHHDDAAQQAGVGAAGAVGGEAAQAATDSGMGEQPTAAPAAPASAEDVNARLDQIAADKGMTGLNYRSSIVDLMKLLGLDSSLQNRTELANELGYTGDTNDSATMNIWLHRQVMESLANRGQ